MENELHLTDLIDVEMLQRIQDAFSDMTGIASVTTDADGVAVTKGSHFSDFCMKYTRSSPLGCQRCELCDKNGAELALKKGASSTYFCHAGLVDFAAPIIADGRMVGCFIGGQVLTEPPDISKIMQVADELGVDPASYIQAVMKVNIVEKSQIDKAASFLYTIANGLSNIAYHKYQLFQANIEIEKANRMKSDFLANMSHEIRTPMNAVIGMAEMALREDLPPAARDYITQIKASGKTLLTIINDILDFSKIESGKMNIIPVEYEPMSTIHDVANIITTRIGSKNVELILDIAPDIPYKLFGDSIRFKQILLNLANNAVKFTKHGRVLLKIYAGPVENGETVLHASIEDTGIGIKKEQIGRLFRSFEQLDSKRNRNIEGTGLGLAISKLLLTLMHGTISVKSTQGKGTSFTVELTLQLACEGATAAAQEAKTQHVDPSHRLRHSRILLVDDNDLNREIAITLLEDEGFTVEYAVNGCEAVEKIMDAPSGHYQLVLMDVLMPVMNGYEATKAIRRLNDPTRAQVPILAMTADAFEEDRQKALRSGMNGHLTKPVEIDKLFEALDELLS